MLIYDSAINFILYTIPSWLLALITFVTVTLPTVLVKILGHTIILSFDFSSILFAFVLAGVVGYFLIRYSWQTRYARLKSSPSAKHQSAPFHLLPDATDADEPGTKSPYQDDYMVAFLASIKIFGYLEKNAFHELTRHFQTRKIPAGELLFRNESDWFDFCTIADGVVQLYVPGPHIGSVSTSQPLEYANTERHGPRRRTASSFASDMAFFDDSEGDSNLPSVLSKQLLQKEGGPFRLLHEVTPGGAISSLCGIISVLTEHVSSPADALKQSNDILEPAVTESSNPPIEAVSDIPLPVKQDYSSAEFESELVYSESEHPKSPSFPALGATRTSSAAQSPLHQIKPLLSRNSDCERFVPPQVVAVAKTDVTVVVIPSEAFSRISERYPTGVAHIIQVILTRFQRVTLELLSQYLGLSEELLNIEKNMHNRIGTYPIDQLVSIDEFDLVKTLCPDFSGMANPTSHKRHASQNVDKFADSSSSSILTGQSSASKLSSTFLGTSSESITNGGDSGNKEESRQVDALIDGPKENLRAEMPPANPLDIAADLQKRLFMISSSQSFTKPAPHSAADAAFVSADAATERSESISQIKFKWAAAIAKMTGMVAVGDTAHSTGRQSAGSQSASSQHSQSSLNSQGFAALRAGIAGQHSGTFYTSDSANLYNSRSASAASDITGHHTRTENSDSVVEELAVNLQIRSFGRGAVLMKEGEHARGLFLVIEGVVEASVELGKTGFLGQELDSVHFEQKLSGEAVSQRSAADSVDDLNLEYKKPGPRKGFYMRAGSLVGYWASLSGGKSCVSYRAKTPIITAFIPQALIAKCLDRHMNAVMVLAKNLIRSLSPLVLQIDLALEWAHARAGHILCRERDMADSIYIVLSGRLRSIKERPQGVDIVGEHGAGESVGEFEMLTNIRHRNTLHAIRDTDLARLPKALFHALTLRHPEIAIRVSRMIALRAAKKSGALAKADVPDRHNLNLKTVTIVPISSVVSVRQFAENLKEAMELMNVSVEALTGEAVLGVLGRHAFSRVGKLKMSSWLADQEERHRLVLYIADSGVNSRWTQQCIRQADCILLVAMAEDEVSIGEYEQLMLGMKTYARKELVLLHQDRYNISSGTTQAWLKSRVWIQAHHHVHLPSKPSFMASVTSSSPTINALKASLAVFAPVKSRELAGVVNRFNRLIFGKRSRNANGASNLRGRGSGNRSDFARLARRLLSRTIGLALGGGGARGIAHIGVLKALEEAGVPIDAVGGTSIGSFVGGLYAKECDHVSVMARAKQFSGRMSSFFRQILDLTWPTTSWFTGHAFNRSIWKCFDDTQIEDCWLPFFCVTTNIRLSRMEIHDSGYIWRYVRASMSLSGFLPPLCDRGDMLLDGGYLNNLPADVMRSKFDADIVIAVDVGSADDTRAVNYGDSLSGFWVTFSRWNPFRSRNTMPIPTIADIQSRLAYVSCAKQLDGVRRMDRCYYLKPPIDTIGTLDFNRFDEVLKIGYDYGQKIVAKWRKDGTLERVFGVSSSSNSCIKRRERRASI